MNIWKVKIWLSEEGKEFLKWNKTYFSFFSQLLSLRPAKQTSKNVADTTFKANKVLKKLCKEVIVRFPNYSNSKVYKFIAYYDVSCPNLIKNRGA